MFAESTPLCFLIITRVLYIYIINIPLSRPFSTFLFLISIILYTKKRTLFPAPYLLPRTFLTLSFVTLIYSLLYTLYREGYTFPQLFTPFPQFYYTPYIQKREHFTRPPFTSYKVNTFSTATFFIFLKCYLWVKFAEKSF